MDGIKILRIGCLVIAVAAAGYLSGRLEKDPINNETERAVQAQKSKDSLKTFQYKEISDSIAIENKALKQANEIIINAKTLIRNEIQRQTNNIDLVSDSSLYYIVDSILRAEYE